MKPTPNEVDDALAPVADAVSNFANSHAMRLQKCVRDNSGWELTCDHAEGGQVFLLMMYDRALGLGVGSVWQFPCPEMSLIYSHFRNMRHCSIEPHAICAMLEEERDAILAVKFGYWTHIKPLQQPHDV